MTGPLAVAGVVGTGAMGMGVVRSLRRHGLATFARDIRPEAQREAAALGARTTDSAAALAAQVDVAILLVVDDRQIDEVLFGPAGAADAFRPGAIVVVSSTVDPLYVAALAPKLAARNLRLVDAPVSGGPARAADGTMTMMASGAADALAACAGLFERIAGRVFVVGERPGDAATFKIVNNLLAGANLAAGAEALALAQRAGIDPVRALEVINASSGASWIVADRMARELAGDRGVRAAAKILAKDVGIAASLAQRLGAPDAFARTARDAFRAAIDAGYGEEDDAALLRFFSAARPR
jgi:3-hydroxyisobutyrate dehydrogenase-like beta-hydroxyacid dehydrogenase